MELETFALCGALIVAPLFIVSMRTRRARLHYEAEYKRGVADGAWSRSTGTRRFDKDAEYGGPYDHGFRDGLRRG